MKNAIFRYSFNKKHRIEKSHTRHCCQFVSVDTNDSWTHAAADSNRQQLPHSAAAVAMGGRPAHVAGGPHGPTRRI